MIQSDNLTVFKMNVCVKNSVVLCFLIFVWNGYGNKIAEKWGSLFLRIYLQQDFRIQQPDLFSLGPYLLLHYSWQPGHRTSPGAHSHKNAWKEHGTLFKLKNKTK